MRIIAEFDIPDDAEPIQATLDYYMKEGNKKGLCCCEVYGSQLKEAEKCLTTMINSEGKN